MNNSEWVKMKICIVKYVYGCHMRLWQPLWFDGWTLNTWTSGSKIQKIIFCWNAHLNHKHSPKKALTNLWFTSQFLHINNWSTCQEVGPNDDSLMRSTAWSWSIFFWAKIWLILEQGETDKLLWHGINQSVSSWRTQFRTKTEMGVNRSVDCEEKLLTVLPKNVLNGHVFTCHVKF